MGKLFELIADHALEKIPDEEELYKMTEDAIYWEKQMKAKASCMTLEKLAIQKAFLRFLRSSASIAISNIYLPIYLKENESLSI